MQPQPREERRDTNRALRVLVADDDADTVQIILDLSIPGLSGYAVARAVRHSFTDMRRPLLIAISGMWKQAGDRLVAQHVGFDHYLVKPCDPREVVQLLNKLGNRGVKAP